MSTGELFPTPPLKPWQGGKPAVVRFDNGSTLHIAAQSEAERIRGCTGPPTLPAAATPHNRTETSRLAAQSVRGAAAAAQQALVLEAIRAHGRLGLTSDGCEVYLGLRHQSASARINGLAKLGLIVDSGERRKTRSGRAAVVWTAAP